jgi:hypothetical protein
MVQLYFCPFCHRFFKDESRILHVYGGPEPIETHVQLIADALEFLGLKSAPPDGLDIDFHVICKFCFSTDRGGASQYW